MPRFHADTNLLLGYTLFLDWWNNDATRWFDSGNALYIGEAVLFEYCNKDTAQDEDYPPPDGRDLTWSAEQGKFNALLSEFRDKRFEFEDWLLDMEDSDQKIELDDVVTRFTREFEIGEWAEDIVRTFFERELDKRDWEVTPEHARQVEKEFIRFYFRDARKKKDILRDNIRLGPPRDKDYSSVKNQVDTVLSDNMDVEIVCDAHHMNEKGVLHTVLTGDKGDAYRDEDGKIIRDEEGEVVYGEPGIYNSRQEIDAITGLRVIYLRDEAPDASL
ncbi:hypothetical protein [Halobellus captivus]|uniref:hypothetical protein n=1 Tax=Halobellus captivus TaxID=2592614 RepID=UPI0011A073F6|nr:hypothetical protein [Halobellus captivus]